MKPEVCRVAPPTVLCPRVRAPQFTGCPDGGRWAAARRLTGLVRADGSPSPMRTTAWLGWDDGYLYVAARCDETNTESLQRKGSAYLRDLGTRDHVDVVINHGHDHVNYCRFSVGPFEQTDVGRGSYAVSYRAGPDSRWLHHKEQPEGGMFFRYASSVEEGRGWSFEMAIPFESLGADLPERGTTWGINISRHTAWPVYQGEPSKGRVPYPETTPTDRAYVAMAPDQYFMNPLVYADLVFDASAPQLIEADFGVPHFGRNRATLRFRAPDAADLLLATRVRPRRPGRVIDPGGEFPLRPDGKGTRVCEAMWRAAHYDDANVLELAVKERATGRVLWRAAYDFGFEDGSLPLYYLHKGETDGAIPDPAPDDPDFLLRKAESIASRQHRFHRRNTRQGAPSDFTLSNDDGTVQFDLMDPACFRAMARYVHGCYENDTDRLLGIMFFAGQPAMMRAHTAYDPAASHRLETASLLRFGTGYCGHMSRVMAAMINRMEIGDTGRRHCARNFGIGGHAIALVEYRGGYALLDSKHMTLYYTLDNRSLATVEEMHREPEIVRRAYPYYIPAMMTFDTAHIAAKPPEALDGRGLILPEAAPPPA